MKTINKNVVWLFFGCFLLSTAIYGQKIFNETTANPATRVQEILPRKAVPSSYKLYRIDNQNLKTKLLKATPRTSFKKSNLVVQFPTPLGVQRFAVQEASVLSAALAKKFPTIKSYVGIGLDDKTAVVRFSNASDGFHAMISSTKYPLYFIDPYTRDKKTAIAYLKKNNVEQPFQCFVKDNQQKFRKKLQKTTSQSDGKLHTYRLALAATGEYSQFHLQQQNINTITTPFAQQKAVVLAAMNTTMTRVNGIFERDLGVTMELVANETDIIYLDGNNDPFNNDDANTLINQSQTICDTKIGDANYDIGHTFSTGAGGLAGLAVVCSTGEKAQGVTGSNSPIGDAYDVDYVAHEMGHQFGANHTQNNDCQRNNATAVEPGSGSTIMGYAGICSPNVQNNGDAYFHAVSIKEMSYIVASTVSKVVVTDVGNAVPTANAGNDYTIPKLTPFVLTGSGTDANTSNVLSYDWEEIDNEIGYTMPPQSTSSGGPLFRSINPSNLAKRYFPAKATVLSGNTQTAWEVLPSVARTMNFSFTVRDNVNATARDDAKVTVDGNSGPFVLTSQPTSATLQGNSTQNITWDVANTNGAPVNCATVSILLSTDGGQTYSTTLKANTSNDGAEQIVLPNISTTQARIQIKADTNVFYAVNAATFSIDKTAAVSDVSFANFSLYPNPSQGNVQLHFDADASQKIEIKLFDIRGRLLNNQEFSNAKSNFSTTLHFSKLVSGLYILSIKNGAKQVIKKLVIE